MRHENIRYVSNLGPQMKKAWDRLEKKLHLCCSDTGRSVTLYCGDQKVSEKFSSPAAEKSTATE